ncbi:glutathione S-transferase C-terminal domain-containing protein [Halioxenophilus aromaticivorans]|uniref:Glutathione S-transferase C-terminal domain-containing protein n=1 Tax=Halioxenophilus aromaticivorans TaxID=1306992 RepID=A0AAV3U4D5_9ALTE
MIKLYGFGQAFGVADPSPFALKINAYMTMAGIEFEPRSGFAAFKNAPKGKLPYIEDEGVIIADSFFILQHLQAKYGTLLEQHITQEQKALTNLIIKSLDENFYWCIVYSRWIREDTWPTIKNTFFSGMPFPLKHLLPFLARKGIKSAFVKHGMGRHSDEEIMSIANDTLHSLSTLLADKPYFFGDQPSTIDTAVYAFLAQVTITDLDNPLNRMAREHTNLVAFCERIRSRYYEPETAIN